MSDEPRNLPEDFFSKGDADQPPQPAQPGQDPYAAPQYGQPGQYGQPADAPQYGQPGQPGQYSQPGQYGQPGDPGQFGQGGQAPYGQDPYSQQPYGQPAYGQQPYGQPGFPAYGGPLVPPHPNASTSMVLGIIGLAGFLLCCGITGILSPFAWAMGRKAVAEIDANPQQYGGRDQARAGQIMGIIGTVLFAVGLLAVIGLFAAGFVAENSVEDSYSELDLEPSPDSGF